MVKHGFCHVEWPTTDFERTTKFYGSLFGWKFTPFGEDYLMFETADSIGGGFYKCADAKPGSGALAYVLVEELEPYLKQAVALGGSVEKMGPANEEIHELQGGMGWISVLHDPDGNRVGLYKGGSAPG